MSLTLSSTELEQVTRAIHLLARPLDHDTVDDWRRSVNRQLKELLCADSVGFLLPVEEGLYMLSEEHDPDELARYQDYPPPPNVDDEPVWAAMIRNRVMTLANWYGENYHLYTASVYYNEYSGANGAHDTLSAAMSLGGTDARSMASIHLWHERPDGRLFGDRETQLLKLLYPAFQAGVESEVRWGVQRQDLLDAIDRLEKPTMVTDLHGRLIHVTPGLEALLADEPESERLRGELWSVAHELRALGTTRALERALPALAREVETTHARYRISGCLYGHRLRGRSAYVIVGLDRATPAPPSVEDLQARFGLTPAQARVALLLARGLSNSEVTEELCISPSTARRHTECVLLKMDVSSRAGVAARLYG